MRLSFKLPGLLILVCPLFTFSQSADVIYSSPHFSVHKDKVVQDIYTARAISSTEMVSDYQSPESGRYSPEITFKFSINLRDNEMPVGQNHRVILDPSKDSHTNTIMFGVQHNEQVSMPEEGNLKPNSRWTVKLDMRDVFREFEKKGYYTLFNGQLLNKSDFKGVYIAGSAAPLTWDFNNLHNREELQLSDPDGDHIYETNLVLNAKNDEKKTDSNWKLTRNIDDLPKYKSDYLISDAIYNLSIEEMLRAIEPDSTFRTGQEWSGVWTRDISYSIILSMAYMQPNVAKNSLMRKVNDKKRIIQDTGTGGAWPVSTDRMVWAVAAYEVYKATGDRKWLELIYEIIKNSIEDDMMNIYDPETGMVKGESSFLDWREQTYPVWMQPADIFGSECLGTNAVHYKANIVLAEIAEILGQHTVAEKHLKVAARIAQGINDHLWMPDKGYYAQYIYGRLKKVISPKSEALGEALCVLWGIADNERSNSVIKNTPITKFGIPCISPQISDIPPYHNNAVWPFVQSYWLWASAESANEQSVLESIAAIYRPAALFLTNKENFVAETGDFNGTQINSSVMLWSLSGNISLVHRVLFGIRFGQDRLEFKPFVPAALNGTRYLTNFKYRDAIIDIELSGYGNEIESFEIDGKKTADYFISGNIKGRHSIKIQLSNKLPASTVNKEDVTFVPFPSEPVYPQSQLYQIIEIENVAAKAGLPYQGYTGAGFVEVSKTVNRKLEIPVEVDVPGEYAIDVRYANGNGPINTKNKCAIRNLAVNGKNVNAFVFPQRGNGEWSDWGYSNPLMVQLPAGLSTLVISFEDFNDNMNGLINHAMLDHLRITKL
mgnify:FL=1